MLHTAPVQLAQRCAEEALDHKGEVVLHYICTLPQIHGLASRAQKRINRYYRHLEQSLQRACRTRRHNWLTPTPCPSPPWKAPWIGRPPTCPTPCGAFPGPGVSLMDVHRWPITGRGRSGT